MRIDVLANTRAHVYRTRPSVLEDARRACDGRARFAATSSLAELSAEVRGVAERGSDLVVLSGGDGSFMAGVTALARAFGEDRLPPIALLPGGTVATVARNWGTGGDPVKALRRLLEGEAPHTTTLRPTLRVRATKSGSPEVEERIGFIFGTGLVARFFDVYYREGARGHAGAARIVARIFVESFVGGDYARRVLEPLPCRIEVDGRALAPEAFSLVCASVVRDLGLHMRVNYRAGEDLHRPHLVASSLPPHRLGPRAPLVLAGKRIGGRGHFDDLVGEFAVRFAGEGPYVLDGDVLRAAEVHVSAGPVIRVVTPG